jgi:hypothetical protein
MGIAWESNKKKNNEGLMGESMGNEIFLEIIHVM